MGKPKHVAPSEDSDDELQVPKPQPGQEDSSEEEDEATSSEEDEDTDEGEDERDKHVQLPRKPQPQVVSKPSSSSSEDDSEPEPEPEPEALLKNAKPSSKLKSPPYAKSGLKRAAQNSVDPSNQKKRGKMAQEDHAASDEGDQKKSRGESKSLFQRVFSEKDEIGILKGLAEFIAKTEKEPYRCAEEFYDFLKGSNLIESNASCNQLKEKIRRMKKKFQKNLAKEKNGKGTTLKPHQLKAFLLGKNVWGGKTVRNEALKKDKAGKSTPKKAPVPHSNEKAEAKSKLNSLALTSMLRYDGTFGKPFGEDYIRKRIELLGVSKREEIEAKWRKFQDAENKLYVEIAEFYAEQAKLLCQANSSSSS